MLYKNVDSLNYLQCPWIFVDDRPLNNERKAVSHMPLRENAPSTDTQQSGFFNVIALTVALKVWRIYLAIKNSTWRGFT